MHLSVPLAPPVLSYVPFGAARTSPLSYVAFGAAGVSYAGGAATQKIKKNPASSEWSFSYRSRTKFDTFGGIQLQLIFGVETYVKVHT